MTSYLIDLVLVLALVVTSWRTGAMYREVRRLRSEKESLASVLQAADASINEAARAVVFLKSEGVSTIAALEDRTTLARTQAERLDFLIRQSDLRAALAEAQETGPVPRAANSR